MTKIVVSLRSIFIVNGCYLGMKNKKSASVYIYRNSFYLFIKSIVYINFRHFSHFAILGTSLDNLIVSQKDVATLSIKTDSNDPSLSSRPLELPGDRANNIGDHKPHQVKPQTGCSLPARGSRPRAVPGVSPPGCRPRHTPLLSGQNRWRIGLAHA